MQTEAMTKKDEPFIVQTEQPTDEESITIEENEQVIDLSHAIPLIETSTDNIISQPTYKQHVYKGFTLTSVLLNPLFAIFLYMAVAAAIEDGSEELKLENKFWEILFTALNLTISILSGLSDVMVVNPMEEAMTMVASAENDSLAERLNQVGTGEKITIKLFTYFNQMIAKTVFLTGAGSAALSVAYVTSIPALQWGMGVPITALELIYLNILSSSKVNEHSYEFLHRLLDTSQSMLLNTVKSPAKSLEVVIQVLINALNRGVTYGYIMEQILKKYFNQNKNPLAITSISYMALASFYTALFSRTLNVHKQFFNTQFAEISAEQLKMTKVSYLGLGVDGLMASLRAGATGILLYRHGPANGSLNILLAGGAGLFLLTHGLYVRYHNRLYQTAHDARITALVLQQKNLTSQEALSSEQLFDLIKEPFKVNRGIKASATVINVGSRLANWFSFLGFLITTNKLLPANSAFSFDFYDLLCVQQLLCNPALENELSFFQENMVDILAYYRTKLHLEKKSPCFGWASFWKAKTEYPKSYLIQSLPETLKTTVEDEAKLAEPAPFATTDLSMTP